MKIDEKTIEDITSKTIETNGSLQIEETQTLNDLPAKLEQKTPGLKQIEEDSGSEKSSDINGSFDNGTCAASNDDDALIEGIEGNMGYIPVEKMTLVIFDEDEEPEREKDSTVDVQIEKDGNCPSPTNKTKKPDIDLDKEIEKEVRDSPKSDDKDDVSSLSEELNLLVAQNGDDFQNENEEIDEELEREIDNMEEDWNDNENDNETEKQSTILLEKTSSIPKKKEEDDPNDKLKEDLSSSKIEEESVKSSSSSKLEDVIEKEDLAISPIAAEDDEEEDSLLMKEADDVETSVEISEMETNDEVLDEINKILDKDEEKSTNKVPFPATDEDQSRMEVDSDKNNVNTEEEKLKLSKLPQTEIQDHEEKNKLKRKSVVENEAETKQIKKPKIETENGRTEYCTLSEFRAFFEGKMQKITKKTLEEFCLQKICEIIGPNCELGKLRQQLHLQEELIKVYRTKVDSLTKQVRDLEIVKTRIIQDLRKFENKTINELIPLKITRSVGLQVGIGSNQRSRPIVTQNIPAVQHITPRSRTRTTVPVRIQNQNTNQKALPKAVKTAAPTRTPDPKPQETPSILNKALLNKGPQTSTPKRPENPMKGVIDLTDEEDSTKKTPTPTPNVRISQQQQQQVGNSVPISTVTTLVATSAVPGSRFTYVMSPAQHPGTQQVITLTPTGAGPRAGCRNIMFKPVTSSSVIGPRAAQLRPQSANMNLPLTMVTSQALPRMPIRFSTARQQSPRMTQALRHPAPLPPAPPLQPSQPHWKAMPPRPSLKISRSGDGIVLSWRILAKDLSNYEEIASYQLYAYQENNSQPSTDMWRKVGDVKALALPMACTLTQFKVGNKYHFAVRAVDVKSRVGPFSQPEEITLT